MWRFPREGPQSPREIEALIMDLVGDEAAAAFWTGFRERFIDEADVQRIAAEGFDHVRLPLNARHLLDDAGRLQAGGTGAHRPAHRVVPSPPPVGRSSTSMARQAGRPARTSTTRRAVSRTCSSSAGRYRERTIASVVPARREVSRRDRSSPPTTSSTSPCRTSYGDRFASELVSLYRDLTAAIRAVDAEPPADLRGHPLVDRLEHLHRRLGRQLHAAVPQVLVRSRPAEASRASSRRGESSRCPSTWARAARTTRRWLQTAFGLYEDLGISWNFWPWKKLDTWTSPVSVVPPEGWGQLVRYAAGEGPRPATADAQRMLDELLDRVRLDACEPRPDVTSALFHRAPVRLAAEAFGFRGAGASHRTARARPLDWFRRDDDVTMRRIAAGEGEAAFDHVDQPAAGGAGFEVELESDDWVEYSFEVPAPCRLDIEVEFAPGGPDPGSPLGLAVDGQPVGTTSGDACVCATTSGTVPAGSHVLRVTGLGPAVSIRALGLTPRRSGRPASRA